MFFNNSHAWPRPPLPSQTSMDGPICGGQYLVQERFLRIMGEPSRPRYTVLWSSCLKKSATSTNHCSAQTKRSASAVRELVQPGSSQKCSQNSCDTVCVHSRRRDRGQAAVCFKQRGDHCHTPCRRPKVEQRTPSRIQAVNRVTTTYCRSSRLSKFYRPQQWKPSFRFHRVVIQVVEVLEVVYEERTVKCNAPGDS